MIGSLKSEASLEFSYDNARSLTILSKRQAGGLCSISKAYSQGEVLGLQLVNPTAGLFSGDSLGLQVTLGKKSKVALTSPSATRLHTMPNGQAKITQNFSIGEKAWLDYWPEITIPQKNSELLQTTRIHLTKSSEMVFLDSLAPGRVAFGENFQFRRLETLMEIYQEGELQAKERCVLSGEKSSWPLSFPRWEKCYYAGIWVAGKPSETTIKHLQKNPILNQEGIQCGASLLSSRLGVVRIIASSSLLLKKTTLNLRHQIQQFFPNLEMNFRKL